MFYLLIKHLFSKRSFAESLFIFQIFLNSDKKFSPEFFFSKKVKCSESETHEIQWKNWLPIDSHLGQLKDYRLHINPAQCNGGGGGGVKESKDQSWSEQPETHFGFGISKV